MRSYFNFHAALVLTLSLSRGDSSSGYNFTSAQMKTRRQMTYSTLVTGIQIIEFCAAEDRLAKQYSNIIKAFQNILCRHDLSFNLDCNLDAFPEVPTITSETVVGDSAKHDDSTEASAWPNYDSPEPWTRYAEGPQPQLFAKPTENYIHSLVLPRNSASSTYASTSTSTSTTLDTPQVLNINDSFGSLQSWFMDSENIFPNSSMPLDHSTIDKKWQASPFRDNLMDQTKRYAPSHTDYIRGGDTDFQQQLSGHTTSTFEMGQATSNNSMDMNFLMPTL